MQQSPNFGVTDVYSTEIFFEFLIESRELVDSGLGAEPKYKGWVLNQSVRAGGPGDFMNLNFVCLIDEI